MAPKIPRAGRGGGIRRAVYKGTKCSLGCCGALEYISLWLSLSWHIRLVQADRWQNQLPLAPLQGKPCHLRQHDLWHDIIPIRKKNTASMTDTAKVMISTVCKHRVFTAIALS